MKDYKCMVMGIYYTLQQYEYETGCKIPWSVIEKAQSPSDILKCANKSYVMYDANNYYEVKYHQTVIS